MILVVHCLTLGVRIRHAPMNSMFGSESYCRETEREQMMDIGELDNKHPTCTNGVEVMGIVPIPSFIELEGGRYERHTAMTYVYPEHRDPTPPPCRRALTIGNNEMKPLGMEWIFAKKRSYVEALEGGCRGFTSYWERVWT